MILAIDPGPESSQWLTWFTCASPSTGNELNSSRRLIGRIETSFRYDAVAIEMIACYGMPVGKEVFETCYFIGQIIEACHRRGIPVIRVYRKDVKLELCGSARAKDANVRQALIDKLGAPGTKKAPGPTYGISGHAWSALAVAWYADQLTKKGVAA